MTAKPRTQAGAKTAPAITAATVAPANTSAAADRSMGEGLRDGSRPLAGGAALKTSTGTDELVRVNVPRKYNFVTPDHVMHTYGVGEQNMRRGIAEAEYSVAHGVTIIGDAE